MPETRVSPVRSSKRSNWEKPREGVQDIQEIAGAREWVDPARTRDDHEGDTRVVEKVEPLSALPNPPLVMRELDLSPGTVHYVGKPPDPVVEVAICLLCQRSESECAVLVELHSGHICDQCTEEAVDAVRQELPKRRLRLAMERMLAGQVSIETVEMIEKMSGGSNG